jgi:hypothetical protein
VPLLYLWMGSIQEAEVALAKSRFTRTSLTVSALPSPLLSRPLPSLPGVVLFVSFTLCIDDHGALEIFRSVSVQHLFDLNFDPNYFWRA